jgi:hypothetical protein
MIMGTKKQLILVRRAIKIILNTMMIKEKNITFRDIRKRNPNFGVTIKNLALLIYQGGYYGNLKIFMMLLNL